ncbi:MarR family transcriptional regulator [Marivita sp. XM-24bin2]|uniref:MarR family winged helix-turn-helix transcriptional regulator n=2 Tax=unclassified Marivita TaxID=2632480 RepID=UPI000D7A00D5|nr:MarR family transcriptional regulator [Marivita sp. XM-24bin2]PWL33385.1 MAG: MarR family transcriptional regulator [Marivita sp. XM-24bin2]
MEALDMPGHLIRRLNQLSTQVFAARMRAIGIDLTPVQFAALDAIRATPGLDQAGIAAMIAYDRATIGGVIERLLQKGYVERTVSARDRRAREITMTKAGEAAYTRILPVVRDLQSDILSSLSEDEAQHLVSLMKKVVGA